MSLSFNSELNLMFKYFEKYCDTCTERVISALVKKMTFINTGGKLVRLRVTVKNEYVQVLNK